MNEEVPSGDKMILDANRGITNIVDNKTIKNDLLKVTDYLFNVLKDHYGPYSSFAALDSSRILHDTTFTKDGIGIIRAIEFASPQEEWVRKTLAFIGTKMEAVVGDGTTSAMMFTCAMIKHMVARLDMIKPVTLNQMREAFQEMLDHIKLRVDSNISVKPFKVTEDGDTIVDTELVKQIAYRQVYTSSHGDQELTDALSEVFVHTPKPLWDRMIWERSRMETGKRFTVDKSQGQYDMQTEVFSKSMLNKDFCTWYDAPTATLLVMNDAVRFGEEAWDIISKCAKEATKENPVVILCHKRWDENTYTEFLSLMKECQKNDRPVAVFNKDTDNPALNDYVSIQLLTDNPIDHFKHGEVLIVNDVHVTFKAGRLTLDNLYQVPEEYKNNGRPERFMVYDGKHVEFNDYLEAVKTYADGMSKLNLTPQVREQQTAYYRMFSKLYYDSSYTLIIGGNTHDNLAGVDVADDAIRATAHALTTGVVFSNNKTLYLILEQMRNIADNYPSKFSNLCMWFVDCAMLALQDIAGCLFESLYPKHDNFLYELLFDPSSSKYRYFINWWYHHAVNLLMYTNKEDADNQPVQFPFITVDTDIERLLDTDPDKIVVQPANSDISMLERFAEVALKFVLTDKIIVHNGAYIGKHKANKRR